MWKGEGVGYFDLETSLARGGLNTAQRTFALKEDCASQKGVSLRQETEMGENTCVKIRGKEGRGKSKDKSNIPITFKKVREEGW